MQEVFKVNMNQFDFQSNLLKEKRRQLIDSLRKKCELNQTVLDAMEQIPRELFVSPALAARSYEDNALPIECGQTISQPYMTALMAQSLELEGTETVLEVGAGSGYLITAAGWPVFFATTMAMAAPALIMLWFLPKDGAANPEVRT